MKMNHTSAICAVLLTVIFLYMKPIQGRGVRRCFACRSRGALGDCKDPFSLNATSAEAVRAVEAQPCASGWCAKVVEGNDDDFDTATERMCVQRPPADGEERCSDTILDRKRVFMCFCQGDLCNAAPATLQLNSALLVAILAIAAIRWRTAF